MWGGVRYPRRREKALIPLKRCPEMDPFWVRPVQDLMHVVQKGVGYVPLKHAIYGVDAIL